MECKSTTHFFFLEPTLNPSTYQRFSYSNVAEALVSKGYATVVRYRQDDDQRSSRYDELLNAEMKATKTSKGVHDKKEAPTHRVADLSGVIIPNIKYFFKKSLHYHC